MEVRPHMAVLIMRWPSISSYIEPCDNTLGLVFYVDFKYFLLLKLMLHLSQEKSC